MATAHLRLDVRFSMPDVPQAAHDPLVATALRRMADRLERRRPPSGLRPARPGSRPETADAPVEDPDIDRRAARSVHRILAAVASLSRRGEDATLGAVVQEADVSYPTLAKALDPATPAGAYAAQLLMARRHGRTRILGLTDAGWDAARSIEKGLLPA